MSPARLATVQATVGAVLLVAAIVALGLVLVLAPASPSGPMPTTTTCCSGRCS